MKEAILEPLLRKMRLGKVLPSLREFDNPRVLDIGCGWEARLLKEIEPYIAQGVGIDFKAPNLQSDKLTTFGYFFEAKDELRESQSIGYNEVISCEIEGKDRQINANNPQHTKQNQMQYLKSRVPQLDIARLEAMGGGEVVKIFMQNPMHLILRRIFYHANVCLCLLQMRVLRS